MWLTSKLRQLLMVMRPGVVTLNYPHEQAPVPRNFRGAPVWDHHKCFGCGACSNHCVSRCILTRDVCQDLRVMLYDGSRCTYCGRCADICPEGAITMSPSYQLACDDKDDLTTRLELFMLTCQRCARCYEMENTNVLDRMDLKGFRYDNLEQRALIRRTTERFSLEALAETEHYQRPGE
jgi:hydrogenase-4 component H